MSMLDIWKSLTAQSTEDYPVGTFENVQLQLERLQQARVGADLSEEELAEIKKANSRAYNIAMGADRQAEMAVKASIKTIKEEAQPHINRIREILRDNGIGEI